MITTQQKDIAHWAMDKALRCGCSAARVSVITATNNSFEYRNIEIDRLKQSTENKLYIEFFVDERYGSFSTNRLEKNELATSIEQSIVSIKYLAPDINRILPQSDRYYKNNGLNLQLYDDAFDKIDTDEKIKLIKESIKEVHGTDNRIVSISSTYGDGAGAEYMIASNGLEVESKDTAFDLTVEVSLKGENDARPESYWYDSAIYWNDLQPVGIAKKALERALKKIGQLKIKSGQYPMLLNNTTSSRLLSPIIGAMYGGALQQKNSFLLDKIGQQITSNKFTISDTPHLPRQFGARLFDGEGVATCERKIIDKGILQTYFIDTYNSRKLEVAPTIASPSVVSTELGERDFDAMLRSIKKGIWITGFNGGNCNPTTGDFSFGIEGMLIENGEETIPIGEMNITGNMLTLWKNLAEVGNDPRTNSSRLLPSMLFEDVNFSGL